MIIAQAAVLAVMRGEGYGFCVVVPCNFFNLARINHCKKVVVANLLNLIFEHEWENEDVQQQQHYQCDCAVIYKWFLGGLVFFYAHGDAPFKFIIASL